MRSGGVDGCGSGAAGGGDGGGAQAAPTGTGVPLLATLLQNLLLRLPAVGNDASTLAAAVVSVAELNTVAAVAGAAAARGSWCDGAGAGGGGGRRHVLDDPPRPPPFGGVGARVGAVARVGRLRGDLARRGDWDRGGSGGGVAVSTLATHLDGQCTAGCERAQWSSGSTPIDAPEGFAGSGGGLAAGMIVIFRNKGCWVSRAMVRVPKMRHARFLKD